MSLSIARLGIGVDQNGATDHAVWTEQLLDGEKTNYSGSSCMSAPET
jgi:hypothetical protein